MNSQTLFVCSNKTEEGLFLSRIIPQITKQPCISNGDLFCFQELKLEMFPLAFELADGSVYKVEYEEKEEHVLEIHAVKVDKPLSLVFA